MFSSDSVRLVNGTNRCSGRLEVRSSLYNQPWSSVCEEHLDWSGAGVVCRELGCEAPSALWGALHEEATKWAGVFRCGGQESALLDCDSSGGNTCSSGKVVELSCSGRRNVFLCWSRLTPPTVWIWFFVVVQNLVNTGWSEGPAGVKEPWR